MWYGINLKSHFWLHQQLLCKSLHLSGSPAITHQIEILIPTYRTDVGIKGKEEWDRAGIVKGLRTSHCALKVTDP